MNLAVGVQIKQQSFAKIAHLQSQQLKQAISLGCKLKSALYFKALQLKETRLSLPAREIGKRIQVNNF